MEAVCDKKDAIPLGLPKVQALKSFRPMLGKLLQLILHDYCTTKILGPKYIEYADSKNYTFYYQIQSKSFHLMDAAKFQMILR